MRVRILLLTVLAIVAVGDLVVVGPGENTRVTIRSALTEVRGVFTTDELATRTATDVEVNAVATDPAMDFGGYRPSYQGYGTTTPAGRGDTTKIVCAVNSLADTGGAPTLVQASPFAYYRGTLRQCVAGIDASFVIAETSGNVLLTSPLVIAHPFLTLAGQTAPSPGLNIIGNPVYPNTHDVVVQHVRIRRGNQHFSGTQDAVWHRDGFPHNIVWDHVSVSWGNDELLSFNDTSGTDVQDVSMVYSIAANPYPAQDNPNAPQSCQLFAGSANGTATLAYNLYANCLNRQPQFSGGWRASLINNVMFNGGLGVGGSHNYTAWLLPPGDCSNNQRGVTWPVELAYVNNVIIPGPDSHAGLRAFKSSFNAETLTSNRIWLRGNEGPFITGADADGQWAGVTHQCSSTRARVEETVEPSWHAVFNYRVIDTDAVEAHVLANAGARPLDRDQLDTSIVAGVVARSGRMNFSYSTPLVHQSLTANGRALLSSIPANPHAVASGESFRTNLEVWLETCAREVEIGAPHECVP